MSTAIYKASRSASTLCIVCAVAGLLGMGGCLLFFPEEWATTLFDQAVPVVLAVIVEGWIFEYVSKKFSDQKG